MGQLSYQTRWMVIGSVVLTVSLLYALIVYIIQGAGIFTVIMLALAWAVFLGTFLARLRKSRYEKCLSQIYYTAYENVGDMLNETSLSWAEKREIKSDVLALLIDAQTQGRTVAEVVGDDIGEFVIRIQASFGYRSGPIFTVLRLLQWAIFFIALFQTILFLKSGGEISFFEVAIPLWLLVMYFVFLLMMYLAISNAIFKNNRGMVIGLAFGYMALWGVAILLANTAQHIEWIRYILDTDVKMISSWWMAVILAAAALLSQIVKWALRRQSVKEL